jgi:dihydroneopterin aldolase
LDSEAFLVAPTTGEARSTRRPLRLFRDLIPRERADSDASPKINWRSREKIGGRDDGGEVDRVFVRDFVVSAQIGAYGFERGISQRVVFDVEALVRRAGAHSDDMRSIFSYDVIRLVVGRDYVDFVETLAEEIASVLLQDARVRSIRVRIRKLGVIEGEVGIEIQRDRASGSDEDGSRGAE